ncbi:hypothetical protein AKJ16_DCAP16468 [Drosera capensis]
MSVVNEQLFRSQTKIITPDRYGFHTSSFLNWFHQTPRTIATLPRHPPLVSSPRWNPLAGPRNTGSETFMVRLKRVNHRK